MGQLMEMAGSLRDSGLSPASLAAVAALFLITIVLSARELLAWYLKVNRLEEQLDELNESIRRLEKALSERAPVPPENQAPEVKAPPPERQVFPLHH